MTKNERLITVWKSGTSVPDVAGTVYSRNRIALRGEVVTITPEMFEETKDRNGDSWLDLSEGQQEARWGEVRFRHGDHSAEVAFIGDDDSTVRYRRRENAVLAARKLTGDARKKAFDEITRVYGPAEGSQRTIREYKD